MNFLLRGAEALPVTDLHYRKTWLALGWGLVGVVIYLSLMPHPPQPLDVSGADKVEHAMAYAGLALWFFQIVRKSSRLGAGVALVLLGVAIEIAQAFTPTRSFELADMGADAVGVVLGAWLVQSPLGRVLAAIERGLIEKAV